jgi:hypothetical protein
MSSLYFGLDVFCLFEMDTEPLPQKYGSTVEEYTTAIPGALASNRQNTSSPKYNDDFSLLIYCINISSLAVPMGYEPHTGKKKLPLMTLANTL